jgi:RNA polymerase sigma-70 factor (ECF subfamily)
MRHCHIADERIVFSTMSAADRIAAAWSDDRAYLMAIASRILADPVEAEDVVQDAFARLAVQPVEEIEDLRGWLVVVVRRLALDRIGSAHHRRSRPSDPHALAREETRADAPDPADRVTLDDEVRRALAVVLDELTPAERAAFLLHDVFGIPFERIGELVGRSPSACRQLASRARRTIRCSEPPATRTTPDPSLQAVADRFIAACAGGDLAALARTLHGDVSGWGTRDHRRVGFAQGVDAVAERVLFFLGPRSGCVLSPLPLDDGIAVVASRGGEPVRLVRLDISDGTVHSMHAVVLPG